MNPVSTKEQIIQFLEENLESEAHFLVQVNIGLGKVQEGKVQVLMDSDSGITIADCASYSRKLGKFLDDSDLFSSAYSLEVASPGLDFPLSTERQFRKNIGRFLLLDTKEGKQLEGKLLSWTPELLDLEVHEKSKGKKTIAKTIQVKATEIVKAKVTVSFK
jgi:ribosome maturation factor RimP